MILYFYFYTLGISLIGFGILISRILKIESKDFGIYGILGITFLSIISYSTAIFFKHNYLFNFFFFILGFSIFLFHIRRLSEFKIELIKFFTIFSILIIFILLAKNHDDFPYYHFPYMVFLTEHTHPIGFGNLNNGFRSPSSIFFISSMFYLPKAEFYLFHLTPAFIMGFANLSFLNFALNKKNFEENNFINFLSLISLMFINIFFYRLAEHGTDRSGMVLVILAIIYLYYSLIYNSEGIAQSKQDSIKIFSILIFFVVSLKPFYLINLPLFLIFLFFKNVRNVFFSLLFGRTFYYCVIILFFTIFYTFLNSSCVIFPITTTCFENVAWSLRQSQIEEVRVFFELWSKAGATPHFIAEDQTNYIKGFNWLENWVDIYFFNKVSDFILGLLLLSVVFIFSFYNRNNINSIISIKVFSVYLILFIFLLEWFLKHPTLRYGGYHLFALIFSIPTCLFIAKKNINFRSYLKKTTILLIITLVIFLSRNVLRINKENSQYAYNPISDNKFKFIGGNRDFYFRYHKFMKIHLPSFEKISFLGKEIVITKFKSK